MLVAISIPIFTAQLRKARVATDLANERAAKAAAVAAVLTDEATSTKVAANHTYYYDASKGIVVSEDDKSDIKAYGKVSDAKESDGFADSKTTTHVDKIVKVTVYGKTTSVKDDKDTSTTYAENEVSIQWVTPK